MKIAKKKGGHVMLISKQENEALYYFIFRDEKPQEWLDCRDFIKQSAEDEQK
jgi:hypothetical protein